MKKILLFYLSLSFFIFNFLWAVNVSDDVFFDSNTTVSIDEMNKIDPDPTPDINFNLSEIDTVPAQKSQPEKTTITSQRQVETSPEIVPEQKQMTKEEIERDIQILLKKKKKYFDSEDYEGAIEIWDRIIQNYPTAKTFLEVRYYLGCAYEYTGNLPKAIEQYQKFLAENPKHELYAETSYKLAGCYSKLEKYPYSMEIYRDLIRKSPGKKETIRAYFNLAQIYMKQEKYKKVINIYRNIMKYYPNTQWEIQARFQLASLFAQIGRYKNSINEYKIIKHKFKDTDWAPMAAMHIGDTYKLAGDYKEAKDAYSRVVYEYYNKEIYVQQAEERIRSLKQHKELETKLYGK